MNLERWAERHLKTIDGDGLHTTRVNLITGDGNIWETWEPPFGEPKEWAAEAQTLLQELANEWPPTLHQVTFAAFDPQNTVRSQCTQTVKGKSSHASRNLHDGGPQALAASMDAQAKTMERILSVAAAQAEMHNKAYMSVTQHTHELYDYVRELRRNAALTSTLTEDGDPTGQALIAELRPLIPVLVQMLSKAAISKVGSNGAARAASAVADSAKG